MTRDDVEKLLWMASGWQADEQFVDAVMAAVDEYVAGMGAAPVQGDGEAVLAAARVEAQRIVDEAKARAWELVQSAVVDDPNRRFKCTGCGGLKAFDRFGRDVRSEGGRRKQCKDCDNKTKRLRYAAKRDGVAL